MKILSKTTRSITQNISVLALTLMLFVYQGMSYANNPPVFNAGESATRSVAADASKGTLLGEPFTATDADNDSLTYVIAPFGFSFAEYLMVLSRFDIDTETGQLKTFASDLQLDPGFSIDIVLAVVDHNTGQDTITVTINVTGAASDDAAANSPSVINDGRVSMHQTSTENMEIADGSPKKTLLLANYPNPFNPETWIPYHLANSSDVQINIYDSRGTVIRQLELGHQRAGYYTSRSHAAYWDGRNNAGEPVASDIYFYQLQTDKVSPLRKMLILK